MFVFCLCACTLALVSDILFYLISLMKLQYMVTSFTIIVEQSLICMECSDVSKIISKF
jgi:hypothetical protein